MRGQASNWLGRHGFRLVLPLVRYCLVFPMMLQELPVNASVHDVRSEGVSGRHNISYRRASIAQLAALVNSSHYCQQVLTHSMGAAGGGQQAGHLPHPRI